MRNWQSISALLAIHAMLLGAPAHAGPEGAGHAAEKTTGGAGEIVTIRPDVSVATKQGLPNFVGISGGNAGSQGLSMNLVVIPPGAAAKAHRHRGYETAIYVLKGRVRTRYGAGLCKSVVHEAGDFVFIPADVPHQPVNLSGTEEARAIVARTDPNEQESVTLYHPQEDEAVCPPSESAD